MNLSLLPNPCPWRNTKSLLSSTFPWSSWRRIYKLVYLTIRVMLRIHQLINLCLIQLLLMPGISLVQMRVVVRVGLMRRCYEHFPVKTMRINAYYLLSYAERLMTRMSWLCFFDCVYILNMFDLGLFSFGLLNCPWSLLRCLHLSRPHI